MTYPPITLRLDIIVFGNKDVDGNVPRWTETWELEGHDREIEPLLLRAEVFGDVRVYLFALDRVEGDVARFLPYVTHQKLELLKDLPQFGYRKVAEGDRGLARYR